MLFHYLLFVIPVAMPCEHGLRDTGVCVPRVIPATGNSLLENRVWPDLPYFFRVLPGKFRELRAFCRGTILQHQAIGTDARGVEYHAQVFGHRGSEIIAGFVITFTRISSDDRGGICTFSYCTDD
jgi:hypothetical protein